MFSFTKFQEKLICRALVRSYFCTSRWVHQGRTQNPVKHLWWSFFTYRLKTIHCFLKDLYPQCLPGFWILLYNGSRQQKNNSYRNTQKTFKVNSRDTKRKCEIHLQSTIMYWEWLYPAKIYLFKFNNWSNWKRYKYIQS